MTTQPQSSGPSSGPPSGSSSESPSESPSASPWGSRPGPPGRRTVEAHRERIAELLEPKPVTDVALDDADGLVLGRDLRAAVPLPGFDNSAMDGYAVRAADVAAASAQAPVTLPVVDDIPAGRSDVVPHEPGTAQRIMTGAPLPPGADAVVPVEWTDAATDQVRISRAPRPEQHVRRAGEDLPSGGIALPTGTTLRPTTIALAAALGYDSVPARPRPRVLVLSTGSELAAPGAELRPGQIYESNAPMLVALIRRAGGRARALRLVPDDVAEFRAALAGPAETADLIVTSGGVSAGAYEVVKDALSGDGSVQFGPVAMQPGGPQGAGHFGTTPIVTFPGNPVSVFVSFEAFLRPALRRMLGYVDPLDLMRPTVRAAYMTPSGHPEPSPEGRRQFLRARYDPLTGTATGVGGPGSHLLGHLAGSNCLVVVPEEVTTVQPGTDFETWLVDDGAGAR